MIGVLTRRSYDNTGLQTFESNIVPALEQCLDSIERIEFTGFRDSYPFSRTIEKFTLSRRLRKKCQGYETVFVPEQSMLQMNPADVDAEIVPYVHDIFPVTRMYASQTDPFRDRVNHYTFDLVNRRNLMCVVACDRIVAASAFTRSEITEKTAFDGDIDVVYQGVDHLPHVMSEHQDIDLLYVGAAHQERKNPDFIREAFSRAAEAGFETQAVVKQSVDIPGTTHTEISDRKLARLYDRSSYYLHPSYAEGFGRCPVEAQSFGTVPLALDREINSEVLGDPGVHWHRIDSPDEVVSLIESSPEEFFPSANASRYKWSATAKGIAASLIG